MAKIHQTEIQRQVIILVITDMEIADVLTNVK